MAEIHQVLWSLAVHAAVHHDAQIVFNSLSYIEPVYVVVPCVGAETSNLFAPMTATAVVFNTRCSLSIIRPTFEAHARTALQ